MKKKDVSQAYIEDVVALKRFRRRLKSKQKSKKRRRFSAGQQSNSKSVLRAKILAGKAHIISAPVNLSFYEAEDTEMFYTDTVNFIAEIRKYYGTCRCVFDFSGTKRVTAAAMVAVYSAVEESYGNGNVKGGVILPRDDNHIRDMIMLTNLKGVIEGKNHHYHFKDSYLPVISGYGRLYIEKIIDHIQFQIYGNEMSAQTEYVFGDAVSETINNVRLHAYPDRTDDEKKWWLLCHVDTDNKQLYLAIYDSGIGIPKTVEKKSWFFYSYKTQYPTEYAELRDESSKDVDLILFKRISDAHKVGLSMTGDVTGTQKDKHGQGSKSIRALVEDNLNGRMWLFSGLGMFKLSYGESPVVCDLPKPMQGTLIQWNIQLA
ncbi:MAG: ATP-binding protein [Piscirickettsiaceae bacterium]|nr:ATP-binding protein [Piscirickettsiaceae bacterium]